MPGISRTGTVGREARSLICYIETDSTEYGSWGTLKEGTTVFDYTHLEIKGRITPNGVENIEKVIAGENQDKLNKSVLTTNGLIKWSGVLSLVFAGLAAFISWMQYKKDEPVKIQDLQKIEQAILKLQKPPPRKDTPYTPPHPPAPSASKKK